MEDVGLQDAGYQWERCHGGFKEADDTPWYGSRKQIETVFVEDGVTKIGAYAFADCVNLTTVTIANSVAYTNDTAFEGCSKLKK